MYVNPLEDNVEGEGDSESNLMTASFTQENCRKMLARMVILDELPFKFVESEGFHQFCRALNPKFVIPSRVTVAKDCFQMYMKEKKKLKNALTRSGQRVCLTTDTWTSVQNINYMVITAHFIDDDWNLHKRILNFCQVANHKGDTIGRAIEKCLEGWGIDRLFTVTVDNASSNDVAIAYLVKKFKGRNGLVLDGEFIHIRCCAHILNLIVSDALKDLHVSIIRIRNAVKYVRSSPARLQIFKDFAKEDKMSTKNCLTMDVPTRWNSTFTMLDGAIKCQKTFERLEEHDPSYLPKDDIPTTEDWDNAKVFVKFLKTFSEEDCAKIWTNKVEEAFRRLCDDYYMRMSKEKYSQTQSCTPIEGFGFQSQSEIPSISSSGSYKARATVHDRFKQSNKTCLDDAKTEVTRYLDEARIDCMGDEYLDLLTWWKVNASRFKIISQVARDIYSIPISTVPSESAFSTGGRVLDSFRSSLTPQTAEALICAQNWIQSKPLDDMTEEIDGAEEIDEEFINIGKEMEAAFENLNNDSMEGGKKKKKKNPFGPTGMWVGSGRVGFQNQPYISGRVGFEENPTRPDPITPL
uniref:HAT C-terminal dimerisation domain-containing protein n=1 Tax=Cucumis melo TaxID=3656 RepID=A0A9I9EIR0_CUCME